MKCILSECFPECNETVFETEPWSHSTIAPYHSNISFTVTAVFAPALGKQKPVEITRQSNVFNMISGVGKPSMIGEITRNEAIDGTLMLAWEPPKEPKGPITNYDIKFWDLIGVGPILT